MIVQLSCEVELLRPISRTVFTPQPNVDSALVRLRRIGPACPRGRAVRSSGPRLRTVARPSPRSLAIALGSEELRLAARTALEELGHPADERAERLAPGEFVELARRLEQWL